MAEARSAAPAAGSTGDELAAAARRVPAAALGPDDAAGEEWLGWLGMGDRSPKLGLPGCASSQGGGAEPRAASSAEAAGMGDGEQRPARGVLARWVAGLRSIPPRRAGIHPHARCRKELRWVAHNTNGHWFRHTREKNLTSL